MKGAVILGSFFMSLSNADAAGFSFEYTHHAGYGDLPVRIAIEGTRATLIRQNGLAGGDAIGVFRADITAAAQKRLAAAAPDAIDSPVPATRDAGYFTVRMRADKRSVDLRFAQHPEAMQKVRALMDEVGRLETGLAWKPVRALVLELTADLVIRLRNLGPESMRLTLGALGVTIESVPAAEPKKVPGVTPPSRVWELASGETTLPAGIELAGGASSEVRLPLLEPPSRGKLYRARFFARGATDPPKPEIYGVATSKAVAASSASR